MSRLFNLAAVAALALLGSVPAQAQQQWTDYRPAGAGYRIALPGTPVASETDAATAVGQVHSSIATLDQGGKTFVVMRTVYPQAVAGASPRKVMTSARDGLASNGKLRETKDLSINNLPARRLIIDRTDTGRVMVVLQVMSGTSLYQAFCLVRMGEETSPDVERFLGSFALVPR
jgi:hypothetical protein